MGNLVKGNFNCPIHGEIKWSNYLMDDGFTKMKWENVKNCEEVKKENGKYKVSIICKKCDTTYTKNYNPDEVTIEKY